MCIYDSYLAVLFLKLEIFQTRVAEKIKTHFMLNKFFSENRTFYEIIWGNMIGPDRPQMTI
jgi:hypothetical protein